MDFYIKTTFIGTDGTHGYVNGDQFELSINVAEGVIKIYECPSDGDWIFKDLNSFLQSWTYVSLE